jgi:hypothetical protein
LRRYQLFEFLDQRWCPQAIRDGATDFLERLSFLANPYSAIRSPFVDAIRATGARSVIDLCSGGGGPWFSEQWQEARVQAQGPLCVSLTDKFPSSILAKRVERTDATLKIVAHSVDATKVPANLTGFRTIFASFHHFSDVSAKQILADAVRAREGIAAAEVTSRTLRAAATICLLPILALAITPGIRPFRWSRLFFTYIVPAIPLVVLWDGLVSCIRTRTPGELLALTTDFPQYLWTSGYRKDRGLKLRIVYLIGLPTTS